MSNGIDLIDLQQFTSNDGDRQTRVKSAEQAFDTIIKIRSDDKDLHQHRGADTRGASKMVWEELNRVICVGVLQV